MYDLACCNLLCKSQTRSTYVANDKFLLQSQKRDVLKGSKDRANMIHDVLVQNSTSFVLLFSMSECNLERSKQLRDLQDSHHVSGNNVHQWQRVSNYISIIQTNCECVYLIKKCSGCSVFKLLVH